MSFQLPVIVTPEYKITLPLSKKEIRIRPFLVKEEKILLTAIEGFDGNNGQVLSDAVLQIIGNCVLTRDVQIDQLPLLDVETIFFEMRKQSIGDVVELNIRHLKNDCNHVNKLECKLDDIRLIREQGHDKTIKLSSDFGIVLKYPTIKNSLHAFTTIEERNYNDLYELIADSIDMVYKGEDFTKGIDIPKKQLIDWIETFTQEHMSKIMKFFNSIPYYHTSIKYKCEKCGEDEEFEVKGTSNFFT